MNLIEEHFDSLASNYDAGKKRNWYYYQALKKVYQERIPEGSSVLEIGCGTGDILASLKPRFGVGIDLSGGMIAHAKEKHVRDKNLSFYHSDIYAFEIESSFEYIVLADVIEHFSDPRKALLKIASLMGTHTKLVLSMANPLWEPILMLGEKVGAKMPEGPHERISQKELSHFLREAGLSVRQKDTSLLLPIYIPFLSNMLNTIVDRIPLINRLGVIMAFVITKTGS